MHTESPQEITKESLGRELGEVQEAIRTNRENWRRVEAQNYETRMNFSAGGGPVVDHVELAKGNPAEMDKEHAIDLHRRNTLAQMGNYDAELAGLKEREGELISKLADLDRQ